MAAARSGTRKVALAFQGIGTGGHLMLEVFKNSADIDLIHIHTRARHPQCSAGVILALMSLHTVRAAFTRHASGRQIRYQQRR